MGRYTDSQHENIIPWGYKNITIFLLKNVIFTAMKNIFYHTRVLKNEHQHFKQLFRRLICIQTSLLKYLLISWLVVLGLTAL